MTVDVSSDTVGPPGRGTRIVDWLRTFTPTGRIGLSVTLFWLLAALIGPEFAPYRPGEFVAFTSFEPASAHSILGSDYLGRDVFSRLLNGVRYTVGLASVAALLASVLGTALALFATVSTEWIGQAIGRAIDTAISVPSKIFALVIVAAFGSSNIVLLSVIAVTYIPGSFRIAQSMAANINAMDYVQVARLRGEGRAYLAFGEILPGIYRPMLADFGIRFIFAILLLSSLSFLGLGVQPPASDLGSLVRENIMGISEGSLAIISPALCIASMAIGINLLIDGLPRR